MRLAMANRFKEVQWKVGSQIIQLISLGTPLIIIISWIAGSNFSLDFNLLDIFVAIISLLIFTYHTKLPKSKWIIGFIQCNFYAMLIIAYFFHP